MILLNVESKKVELKQKQILSIFTKHTHKNGNFFFVVTVMGVLISLIMVIISQCIHISKHQLYTLNIYNFYLSIIPQ